MATACFRLFTFAPLRPDFKSPRLYSRITFLTFPFPRLDELFFFAGIKPPFLHCKEHSNVEESARFTWPARRVRLEAPCFQYLQSARKLLDFRRSIVLPAPSYFVWGADRMPLTARLSVQAINEINAAIAAIHRSDPGRDLEVGGILLGAIDSDEKDRPAV